RPAVALNRRGQGWLALEPVGEPGQRVRGSPKAARSRAAGTHVAVTSSVESVGASEGHVEAGDEAPVGGDRGEDRGDPGAEGVPGRAADDEGDHRGGRDRIDAVNVAEDGAVAMDAGIEGEQRALCWKRRLVGQKDVGGDVAAADQGGATFLQRPSSRRVSQLVAMADGQAAIEDLAVTVHVEAEAEELWWGLGVGGANPAGDPDLDWTEAVARELTRKHPAGIGD